MRSTLLRSHIASLALITICASLPAQQVPEKLYSGMVWRNIGPFRGGRVSAVTGAIGQPGVYYMGLPAGGVWKTTSAGTTWFPIFDSIKEASSVGAVEAAPSDPNIIYVGMGDMISGGGINRGNGVYKSTDAGATWKHIGLHDTEHIPSILVDPKDPNIVMVAAQGSMTTKSAARGLFRSTDGGATWTKTLNLDDETGVQRIARAFDHPEIILASTQHYYSAPGQVRGGGGGGGRGQGNAARLFKSTDEGVTWKELTGGGLPDLSGRTCVAVAMHTNAQRMFIVGNFGLYRSDDGGTSWKHMDATDRRVANGQGGYNCGVYVNTANPDIVYIVNTCSYRSLDGGKTFTGFKGAPGGDDPQQMWLDPTDGNRLFFGTDQGSTISLDGGLNWSSWYNQATAQVYHISVDNRFPYWVYATQQDSGSIATASRGNFGEITPLDWLPHPGYEFGSIVADPLNPNISYAGGPGGGIIRTTYPSGQWFDVSPNLDSTLALRKVSNQPLIYSPKNPHELFTGFQYVMSTTDNGATWRKLSPDLSLRPGQAPPVPPTGRPGQAGRPPAAVGTVSAEPDDDADQNADDVDEEEEEPAEQRPGFGGAIESISISSLSGDIIWAGTSNGLIKLSRDHGVTWKDVSIPDFANKARPDISAIDASHLDAGTAYAAIDCHGAGDYHPYIYRTRNFGATWTPILTGLPTDEAGGSFARVVRADTERRGLIFAGTESSAYFSVDDGDHWQPLRLNLPTTSVRDMVVTGSDLVVGTYGRGFWILDDISPLRQVAESTESDTAHLFRPAAAVRVRRNVNGDTPFPPEVPHAENPPLGAILYYYLAEPPRGDVTIEISDATGKTLRKMTSAPVTAAAEPPPPVPDFWVQKPSPLPTAPGLNRTNWDLRCDSPSTFSHSYEINANPGGTPPSPEGPLVIPGVYTVTLTVNGRSYKQSLTVKNDPRSPASAVDLKKQYELQTSLLHCIQDSWSGYHQVAATRAEIAALLKTKVPADVEAAATELDTKLTAIGGSQGGFGRGFGGGGGGGFGGGGGGVRQPTFSTVNSLAVRQIKTLDSGDSAPTAVMRTACTAACQETQKVAANWDSFKSKDLPVFNALLVKNSIKPIGGGKETASVPKTTASK